MYRGYVGVCVYIYIYISIGSESSVWVLAGRATV